MSGKRSVQETCARVAQLLYQRRIERNLSLTKVSEASGLSRQGVSYFERGLRTPNLDTLLRIAEVLEVDLAEILREASRGEAPDTH